MTVLGGVGGRLSVVCVGNTTEEEQRQQKKKEKEQRKTHRALVLFFFFTEQHKRGSKRLVLQFSSVKIRVVFLKPHPIEQARVSPSDDDDDDEGQRVSVLR